MNPAQMEAVKARTLRVMEEYAKIEDRKVLTSKSADRLVQEKVRADFGALGVQFLSHCRKLTAAGVKPGRYGVSDLVEMVKPLPRWATQIKEGTDYSKAKEAFFRPKKKAVPHQKRLSKVFSAKARLEKSKKTTQDRNARAKELKLNPQLRVGPPNMPQQFFTNVKSVAKDCQMFSVTGFTVYPDESGQWWAKISYNIEETKPLGFFGVPSKVPATLKSC
jgi:hypothetical protein